jgi:hypothetical protein
MADTNSEGHDNDNSAFENRIKALYVDEHFPTSGQSITSFYRQLKVTGKNEGRSLQEIKDILLKYPAYVTQIPARINFPRRNVDKLGPFLQAQCDLAEMPRSPRGSAFILVVIDIFTQQIFAKCLADKNSETTAAAFADVLDENPMLAANLQALSMDFGGEFQGAFAKLLQSKGIRQFWFRGLSKAQYAEHAIKLLKGRLYAIARGQLTDQWDLLVPDIVQTLNETYNSAIDCTPEEAGSLLAGERVRAALERNIARRNRASSKKYSRLKEPEFFVSSYVYADYKRPSFGAKQSDSQRGQVNLLELDIIS